MKLPRTSLDVSGVYAHVSGLFPSAGREMASRDRHSVKWINLLDVFWRILDFFCCMALQSKFPEISLTHDLEQPIGYRHRTPALQNSAGKGFVFVHKIIYFMADQKQDNLGETMSADQTSRISKDDDEKLLNLMQQDLALIVSRYVTLGNVNRIEVMKLLRRAFDALEEPPPTSDTTISRLNMSRHPNTSHLPTESPISLSLFSGFQNRHDSLLRPGKLESCRGHLGNAGRGKGQDQNVKNSLRKRPPHSTNTLSRPKIFGPSRELVEPPALPDSCYSQMSKGLVSTILAHVDPRVVLTSADEPLPLQTHFKAVHLSASLFRRFSPKTVLEQGYYENSVNFNAALKYYLSSLKNIGSVGENEKQLRDFLNKSSKAYPYHFELNTELIVKSGLCGTPDAIARVNSNIAVAEFKRFKRLDCRVSIYDARRQLFFYMHISDAKMGFLVYDTAKTEPFIETYYEIPNAVPKQIENASSNFNSFIYCLGKALKSKKSSLERSNF